MNKIFFEEKQYFRQWWARLLTITMLGDALWQLLQAILQIKKTPELSVSLWNIIPPILLIFAVVLLRIISLQILITDKGIGVRFYPFRRRYKLYLWEDIKKVYIRDYEPMREYGGWGVKGFGGNRALNVTGIIGLQIVFINDNRLLIGTQKKETLKDALSQMENIPFQSAQSL